MPLILIVEDDDDTRALYKESLDHLGYRTTDAANGEAAIEAALRFRPDFILMDISMPGIDGIDTTRRLKSDSRTQGSIVIVLTGHGMTKFAEARAAGCEALFCKPFDPSALDRVLRTLWSSVIPTPMPMAAGIVKRCGCGREFSREHWLALPVCGRMHSPHRASAVEFRHCSCGSSLAMELHVVDDTATKEAI